MHATLTSLLSATGRCIGAASSVVAHYPTLLSAPIGQFAPISQSMPSLGSPVQFGSLETAVVRITNDGKSHGYATQPCFSADGSKLLLGGKPYTVLNTADWSVYRSGISQTNLQLQFFDPVDPSIIWGHDDTGSRICKYNVVTDVTTIYTVPGGYSGVIIGEYEGSISDDGRYLILCGHKNDGNAYVMVWDTVAEAVEGTLTLTGYDYGNQFDNAHISKSGNYVVIASDYPGNKGHLIYDRATLTFLRAYTGGGATDGTTGSAGHMDIGYRTDGSECLVRGSDNREIVSVRLSDGDERVEVAHVSENWNAHISCQNRKRNGYAYISHYWYDNNTDAFLYREIYAVKLDGSGSIERFGQSPWSSQDLYATEPKACASPLGDMVAFTSGWGTDTPRDYVLYAPIVRPDGWATPTPPAGVNLVRFSQDLANGYWSQSNRTVTAGNIAGPLVDNADTIAFSGTDGSIEAYVPLLPGDYTYSFYAKHLGGLTDISYTVYCSEIGDFVAQGSYFADLAGGAWVRIEVPFTVPANGLGVYIDATHWCTDTGTLGLFGQQINPGLTATPYVRALDYPVF